MDHARWRFHGPVGLARRHDVLITGLSALALASGIRRLPLARGGQVVLELFLLVLGRAPWLARGGGMSWTGRIGRRRLPAAAACPRAGRRLRPACDRATVSSSAASTARGKSRRNDGDASAARTRLASCPVQPRGRLAALATRAASPPSARLEGEIAANSSNCTDQLSASNMTKARINAVPFTSAHWASRPPSCARSMMRLAAVTSKVHVGSIARPCRAHARTANRGVTVRAAVRTGQRRLRRRRGVRAQPRPHGRGRRQGAGRLSQAARGRPRRRPSMPTRSPTWSRRSARSPNTGCPIRSARVELQIEPRARPISTSGRMRSSAWRARRSSRSPRPTPGTSASPIRNGRATSSSISSSRPIC